MIRLAPAAFLVLSIQAIAAPTGDAWDVKTPRGVLRKIDYVTEEGTAMSVDVSPDGKWIVFDLVGSIYRIPASGGEAELLTRDAGQSVAYHPRYSPDGSTIAYVSDRGGQNNLWLMNEDGSAPRPLASDPDSRFTHPAWTPDGKSVIATRIRGIPGLGMEKRDLSLWMFDVGASEGRELAGGREPQPAWPSVSPDGRWVYFDNSTFDSGVTGGAYTEYHLERLELATGKREEITRHNSVFRPPTFRTFRKPEFTPPDSFAPEISPNGKRLAFVRRIMGGETSVAGHRYSTRTALWLHDLETGRERVIMDPIDPDLTGTYARGVIRVANGYAWEPKGDSLIIPVNGRIRRLYVDTGKVETIPFKARVQRQVSEMARVIVATPGDEFQPRFVQWPAPSPDGRTVAFYAAGQIWIKDLVSGTVRALEPMPGRTQMMPSWSPDGRWIAFVTWDDSDLGHLWKAPASGGKATRLTREGGEYLHPSWHPDGKAISVITGSGEARRGDVLSANLHWYLHVFAATGKSEERIRELPDRTPVTWNRDRRLYFLDTATDVPELQERIQSGDLPAAAKVLTSIAADGTDVRRHALFSPFVDQAIPSPDGRQILFHSWMDVFLAPAPQQGGLLLLDHFTPAAGADVTRVSATGGWYPAWIHPNRFGFVNGTEYQIWGTAGLEGAHELAVKVPRFRASGKLALVGATILPMAGNTAPRTGSLIIEDGRIACVFECPIEGADVIDVTGKFIMPGLIDVHDHDHLWSPEFAARHHPHSALQLAYGVTTAVDPYGVPTMHPYISDLTASGRVIGPRYYFTGLGIHDANPAERIQSYEDASRLVESRARTGAIGIKEFHLTNRVQSQMLAAATRDHGNLYFTAEQADLPYTIGLVLDGHTGWEHMLSYHGLYSDVTQFLGQAGVTYSPTLIVGGLNYWGAEYFVPRYKPWLDAKYTRFIPWQWLALFPSFGERPLSDFSFPFIAEGVAGVVRAGGNAAIGAHGEVPGMGAHFEMQIYAEAMTSAEVLRMATMGGAHFTGIDRFTGSLEAGKLADLIILDANPLEDIRNTLRLHRVMRDGVLYDADTLDELWPRNRPFGPVPWKRAGDLGPSFIELEHWDR